MKLNLGKTVVGILMGSVVAIMGYNWITTGCPTGICPAPAAVSVPADITNTAAVVPAADTASGEAAETPACCAHLGYAACGDPSACADMPAEDPTTQELAETDSLPDATPEPVDTPNESAGG